MFGLLRPGSPEQLPISPENSPPPPMSMAAPPSGQFRSREDLLGFLKDWAASQGYAIVIGRSRVNRLWLKCDRGGAYTTRRGLTEETRQRKRGESRLTECPFKVLANIRKDGIWRCHTEVAEHNHGASEDLSVHPSLRRMTDDQIQKVNEMTEANNSPVEILEELHRLWPAIKVLKRDIYNARKKYKTEKELTEIAQGLHQPQPYEDPNGKMPGPTPNGRWEWLEEGDEIKRKKKKRNPVLQGSSTPEPGDPNSPLPQLPTRRQASTLGYLPPKPFQVALPMSAQQQRAQAALHHPHESPSSRGSLDSSISSAERNNADSHFPTQRPGLHNPTQHNTRSGSRIPPQTTVPEAASRGLLPPPAGMPDATPPAGVPGGNMGPGPSKAPSGQVLMSRIERMEKEQRDQKNMLAQILGAVQGMGGGGGGGGVETR